MILLWRPKHSHTTKYKWESVGFFFFNWIKLSWWWKNFRKFIKPFQHSSFLFIALITSIYSWKWLDTLRTYHTTCQAAETLLHLCQYTYSCVLSNLPRHLGSKGKGNSLWPLPPSKGKHLLLWLWMYENRSLTSVLKVLPTRTIFSSWRAFVLQPCPHVWQSVFSILSLAKVPHPQTYCFSTQRAEFAIRH